MAQARIGLDLDGTIVLYDEIFHELAVRTLGMPAAVPRRKLAVRAWVRELAEGETRWIELQRLVYGPGMVDARPAPGVREFLRGCSDAGIAVSIISHRTPLSAARPPVDLHAAALRWLERNAFLSDRKLGLGRENVYLEPTRAAKIERIRSQQCLLFVDDLEEVFAEPAFPPSVERWLYAPGESGTRPDGTRVFSSWTIALQRVLELGRSTGA